MSMPPSENRCLIAAAGLLAFAAVYALDVSEPMYYPNAGVWAAADAEELGPGMGWYARSAWGLGAGFGAAGLTAGGLAILRPNRGREVEAEVEAPRRLSDRGVLVLTLLVLGALLALMIHIVAHELHGLIRF